MDQALREGEAVHGVGDVEALWEGSGQRGRRRTGGRGRNAAAKEKVDYGGGGGLDRAAEGCCFVCVDIGACGQQGAEGGKGARRGREGEQGLDFLEEDRIEDLWGRSVSEECSKFGWFGRVRGKTGEKFEAAVDGIRIGPAVPENEFEQSRVTVSHGWRSGGMLLVCGMGLEIRGTRRNAPMASGRP